MLVTSINVNSFIGFIMHKYVSRDIHGLLADSTQNKQNNIVKLNIRKLYQLYFVNFILYV